MLSNICFQILSAPTVVQQIKFIVKVHFANAFKYAFSFYVKQSHGDIKCVNLNIIMMAINRMLNM